MTAYTVTIKQRTGRTVRNVIASSSMKAAQIALRLVPDSGKPFLIVCKAAA